MVTLPLTPWANITYVVAPTGAVRQGFNVGLIVGTSTVISAGTRVVEYSSLAAMVTAGFATNTPEYLAAQLYFAATSQPTTVAIGRRATGETPTQAITACRATNSDWYIAYDTGAGDSDQAGVAAYIQALTPYSLYFCQASSNAVRDNTGGNVFAALATALYSRTWGIYSTTNYAAAAVMGYAMGATSDLANSAYTLKFKTLPSVTPEAITTAQVSNVEGNNGNVYVNRGVSYNGLENGTMFDGSFFDTQIFLDKLANEISVNVGNLLYQTPKIPQTEAGMSMIRTVIANTCDNFVTIGFLAPGVWNGASITPSGATGPSLLTGQLLPAGYMVLSGSINAQSQSDRNARKAPPIYVPVKLAGAVHSVLIQVNVNQ